MRMAFLGSETSWYLADLRRAAGQHHLVEPVAFEQLASSILTSTEVPPVVQVKCCQTPLDQYDAILVRTMPAGSLEQVVFRMDALASLEANGTRVINPPKAIEAAVDKYLTTSRLARAGILTPQTITCQTAEAAFDAFHSLGGDVVVKPIFGAKVAASNALPMPAQRWSTSERLSSGGE